MRALLLLLAAGLAGAQDPVRFRAEVNLVNVAFTVLDARGALVAGLGKEDFEVFEDGLPQTIAAFVRSADSPLALGLWWIRAAVRAASSTGIGRMWSASSPTY